MSETATARANVTALVRALEAEVARPGHTEASVVRVLRRHDWLALHDCVGLAEIMELAGFDREGGGNLPNPSAKAKAQRRMDRLGAPPYVQLRSGRVYDKTFAVPFALRTGTGGRAAGTRSSDVVRAVHEVIMASQGAGADDIDLTGQPVPVG